ncbi:MAG: phosphoribosylglycinamide formyltransferase [Deltaproteobacteria bacterium]|nr:phosphoribosylglycinamide formyltransferase [Deltaproteobacteria bacterium]
MKTRVAILISGRGSNMVALLDRCREGTLGEVCEPVVVASSDPAAPGLDGARARGVPTVAVPCGGLRRRAFDEALVAALEPFAPDLLVLAGFMRLLTPVVLDRWAGRVINIHPADSRAYQGAHGYEWAWEARLEETLITVHVVDEGMDTGPILDQAVVDLRGARDLDEVRRRGLAVEHLFYGDVLERICRGESAFPGAR